MAEFSSTLNEDKNINRSDPSRMYSIGQTPLAQLRPDKFDDMALKKQISIVNKEVSLFLCLMIYFLDSRSM
jgi:hypothetical protein